MVTLMSACPATSWAMCGGMPFITASVMKSLRKSWGVKFSGLPLASVSPVPASAAFSRARIPWIGMGRCSTPICRWNSSGIGGFQTRSWMS